MTGAMYAAIGGLKTHMTNLNVIGNNIANVNTQGYKDQRMTFQESLYTTRTAGSNGGVSRGGNNPSQVGYGAQVGSIDLNMSPGTFSPTGRDLDCMIEGDGFFLVGDKNLNIRSADDLTKPMLTRVGNFWQDPNGYITDRAGNVVYGFKTVLNPEYNKNATEDEIAQAKEEGRNIGDQYIISTELVPLRLPLAAQEPTVENGGIVMENGKEKKLWDAGDPVYEMLSGAGDFGSRTNVRLDDLAFYDENGKFKTDITGMGTPNGTEDETLTYNGPKPNFNDECIQINGLEINEMGAIIGQCENGQTVVVGYAAIAKVMSPDGVTHLGGPYYAAQEGSGKITVGAVGGIVGDKYLNNQRVTEDDAGESVVPPLSDALGKCAGTEIQGGGLEASTADMATEFSNMILTQRGYQANTRIVTVTDSMLEELVNMKR